MRVLACLFLYMIFAGLIGGTAHNLKHETCNTKGGIDFDLTINALLWPVAIGYAISIDDDKFETKCDIEVK